MTPLFRPAPSRRQFLRRAAGGFGALALSAMLAEAGLASAGAVASAAAVDPLAPRLPHFAPKAKRVIFLYMTGGVSHVESFDYKPKLIADGGKTLTVDNWQGRPGNFVRYLKRPQWEFRPGGR